MWWLNTSWQLSSHSCSVTSPQWTEGENWKSKSKKTHRLRKKDSFIGKAKVSHTGKANHSLFPMGREVSSQLQESQALSHLIVTWEHKLHHWMLPCFLLVPPALYVTIGYGIFRWIRGVTCTGRVPSQLLVRPQPAHWWAVRSRKHLDSDLSSAQQQLRHFCVINTVFSTLEVWDKGPVLGVWGCICYRCSRL